MSENIFISDTANIKYAGFRKRLLAYLVDMLILVLVGFGVQSLMGQSPLLILKVNSLTQYQQLLETRSILPTIFLYILTFGFYILMWVNNDGATPGKQLMGIKIVKSDGSKIGYPSAILRSVFGYTLSSVVSSLGFLWVIWDKKKQGWHDKIANTVVIETGKKPRTLFALLLAISGIVIVVGIFFLFINKARQLVIKEAKIRPVQTTIPKSRF